MKDSELCAQVVSVGNRARKRYSGTKTKGGALAPPLCNVCPWWQYYDVTCGSDGRDSLGYVPYDGIETLPPGLPLPNPDRTGIEQGPAAQAL